MSQEREKREIEPIRCPECDWDYPTELISSLLRGQAVYCEKCGSESKRSDFNEIDLKKNIKEIISVVKKQSGKALFRIKEKLKTYRNK